MSPPPYQRISDLLSFLPTTDVSSQSLLRALDNILAVCQSIKHSTIPTEAFRVDAALLLKAFDALKFFYLLCQKISSAEKDRHLALSRVFEFQAFFLSLATERGPACLKCDGRIDIGKVSLSLMGAANAADLVDPRLSLPIWKLTSNFLHHCKNELKNCADFANDALVIIHNSARHFLQEWLGMSQVTKEHIHLTGSNPNLNPNQKMLNLLCRIATFCIREFATVALANKSKAQSGLFLWLIWLLSTRYGSGLKTPEALFPLQMLPHLETSLFLSLDVALDHLCTLPISVDRAVYRALTDCFLAASMDPPLRLRMYSGILAQLTRHPRCYNYWISSDFNLYEEFIDTSVRLHTLESDDGIPELLGSCVDEFYVTTLQQICASICGLPANCFFFLEKALIKGLLSNHPWTNMLTADIWCFVARYGTGDLCWQYATLFAAVIQQAALRLSSLDTTVQRVNQNRVTTQLDILGRLLSRFLVFLTPKQQIHFLRKYPLTHTILRNSSDVPIEWTPSLIWRFVPLSAAHLQTNTRSLIESQLSDKLASVLPYEYGGRAEEDTAAQFATETALALRLVDSQPASWLTSNALLVAKVAHQSLAHPAVVSSASHSPSTIPCSLTLWDSLRRPLCALSHHLSMWTMQLDPDVQTVDQLLEWLASETLICSKENASMCSLLSFVALHAWYLWTSDCTTTVDSPNSWPQALRTAMSGLHTSEMVPFCRAVYNSLAVMLPKLNSIILPDSSRTCDSQEITSQINQMITTFDRLESFFSHSSIRPSPVELRMLQNFSARLTSFLLLVSGSSP